jgi:hypothetical protein
MCRPYVQEIQDVSEVMVKNLGMELHTSISKTVSVNMGPQMNRLQDIAHIVLRSATDLFVYMHAHFILYFCPMV